MNNNKKRILASALYLLGIIACIFLEQTKILPTLFLFIWANNIELRIKK